MKLLLFIGLDTFGIDKYKNKMSLRRYLSKIRNSKKVKRKDALKFIVFNRPYSAYEIEDSEIFTLNEYFNIMKAE